MLMAWVFGAAALQLAAGAAAAGPRRPDVVWILMDDFGYNDWGLHNARNSAEIRTPNLDALATDPHGVHLERFYSQPICTPTRTQMLSGRYQIHTGMQHGVQWHLQPNGLPRNESTIAERLRPLGYATHAVGKWHIGDTDMWRTPLRRGFDSFLGFWGGGEDYYSHYSSGLLDFRNGEQVERLPAIQAGGGGGGNSNASYSTHLFSQRVVDIIEQGNTSTPIFVYLAYQATHAPLQAPPEVVASFASIKDKNRRVFAAMAAVADEGVGNITAALKASGRYENSVLFFTGDNGGTNRSGGNNWPLRGFKGSLWEGGMRQSAFVHSPLFPARGQGQPEGFVWRGLSHVSDLLPTTLHLAGAASPLPAELDGHNLWPALMTGGPSPRTELLHEIDRIAKNKYACGGPNDFDGEWDVDKHPVRDRFVRAALHSVVNGTHYKLVAGECAGWDTDSRNIPPPHWTPPPTPGPLPARCGAGPRCTPNGTCESPEARDRHMTSSCFNAALHGGGCPPKPEHQAWLFDLDEDPGEYCDLGTALPAVAAEMMLRLKAYGPGEVPARYPPLDTSLDPKKCNPPLDYWYAAGEKHANGSLVCG